jgi:hypothetical protein
MPFPQFPFLLLPGNRSFGLKEFDNFRVLNISIVKRSAAPLVFHVNIRPIGYKKLDDFKMPLQYCLMERSVAIIVFYINICPLWNLAKITYSITIFLV